MLQMMCSHGAFYHQNVRKIEVKLFLLFHVAKFLWKTILFKNFNSPCVTCLTFWVKMNGTKFWLVESCFLLIWMVKKFYEVWNCNGRAIIQFHVLLEAPEIHQIVAQAFLWLWACVQKYSYTEIFYTAYCNLLVIYIIINVHYSGGVLLPLGLLVRREMRSSNSWSFQIVKLIFPKYILNSPKSIHGFQKCFETLAYW